MGSSRVHEAAPHPGAEPLTVPQYAFGTRGDVPPADLLGCSQVHGCGVLVAAGAPPSVNGREGDAIITDTPGACVGVRTADCLPVLLYARGGRVVGAVHAGWRGSVAGVTQKAVAAMTQRFGVKPEEISALIGPCIRPCCYEVGGEVQEAVAKAFPQMARKVFVKAASGRLRLDLAKLNRLQLEAVGVTAVRDGGGCTACETDLYHSHRRDREEAGRMVSWVRANPLP